MGKSANTICTTRSESVERKENEEDEEDEGGKRRSDNMKENGARKRIGNG